ESVRECLARRLDTRDIVRLVQRGERRQAAQGVEQFRVDRDGLVQLGPAVHHAMRNDVEAHARRRLVEKAQEVAQRLGGMGARPERAAYLLAAGASRLQLGRVAAEAVDLDAPGLPRLAA